MQRKNIKFYKTVTMIMFIVLHFTPSLTAEDVEYLNDQMLAFANENKGKQIGRGECWGPAAKPLKKYSASWDGKFGFGKKVGNDDGTGLKMEPGIIILPGDFIQFTNVQTAWIKSFPDRRIMRGWETLGMPYHTAIVRNFNGKRDIVETNLELSDIKSGTYIIYRPFRITKSSAAEQYETLIQKEIILEKKSDIPA